MSNTFFISDTHFGHEKIIDPSFSLHYRKFNSIKDHDEAIVTAWNSVVRKNDVIWHLGDVLLGNSNFDILSLLEGRKFLVLGNHDTALKIKHYAPYFEKIVAYHEVDKMIVSHIPVHESQLQGRFSMNIHGHVHANTLPDSRYFNVSCEAVGYVPVSIDEIRKSL